MSSFCFVLSSVTFSDKKSPTQKPLRLPAVFVVSGAASNNGISYRAALEGIIISDGWSVSGGGLGVDRGATVDITMCTFFQNMAWGQHFKGGAIVAIGASTSINLAATVFWENNGTHGASDIFSYYNETVGSNPTVRVSQSSCLQPYNSSLPKMGPLLDVEGQSFVGTINSWICFPEGTFNDLNDYHNEDDNDSSDDDDSPTGGARGGAWHEGKLTIAAVVISFIGLGW